MPQNGGRSAPGEPVRLPLTMHRGSAFLTLVAFTTGVGAWMMVRIVGASGLTPLEGVILALFVPTFAWIVVPFWTALAGFVLCASGRHPLTLERLESRDVWTGGERASPADSAERTGRPLLARTALVMPVYNEDPRLVAAGLSAMARSLEATGQGHCFHVHILSDTNRPDIARAEEAAWARLQGTHPEMVFFYRRREQNVGRKAGNIAEFCHRCGDDYELMVVLDADSLMAGETLLHLVRSMEDNPGAALIQTLPLPARQETLFGRFIQFAASVYAPVLATGQAFWQGESANYWGHNAIVRMAPFRDHAQLPTLPGRPPWGGEILSHDFVEAALLRKAGWQVLLEPTVEVSLEEVPGNLVDYARRDRRWAQGSLQHLGLLGWSGLRPWSRVHFLLGAMGYISSFLWLLILLAGTAYVLLPALGNSVLGFSTPPTPPPLSLLAVTAAILFLPKVMGLLLALRRPARFGGGRQLVASVLVETLFSVLLAPVMMVHHTRFVVEIVSGRSVAWDAQVRGGGPLPWRVAARAAMPAALLGTVWATATLLLSPAFFLWMSPVFAGLLAAPVLVRWSGSRALGATFRRLGLLRAPSEIRPPSVLRAMEDALAGDHRSPAMEPTIIPRPVGALDLSEASGVSDLPDALATTVFDVDGVRMYNAERGLFELRRGRPLLVTDGAGERHALVASVEGLGERWLRALESMGRSAPRLVVTRHRAAAMGLAPEPAGAGDDLPSILPASGRDVGVTLCLDSGVALATVRWLSAGPTAPWWGSFPVPCPHLDAEAAGLRLARLGQLLPALVSIPVSEPLPSPLEEALATGTVLTVGAAEIRAFVDSSKSEVVRVSEAPVPLPEAEHSRFILFRETCGLGEHVAILVGSEDEWPDPLPVRFHSACLTGDLFGSLRCDCGEQLRGSMEYFASRGGGVLVYLAQEGRGIGLGNKFRAYSLQETGLDTIDADGTLGFGADERRYDVAAKILEELGIRRVELLTNNPEKVAAAEAGGLEVVRRRPLHGQLNRHNLPYVQTKVDRAGHWLHGMLQQGVTGD